VYFLISGCHGNEIEFDTIDSAVDFLTDHGCLKEDIESFVFLEKKIVEKQVKYIVL
jgi:hypothetical protein